jgi:hypothetical protein
MKKELTQGRLKELLYYCPETGKWSRLKSVRGASIRKPIGSRLSSKGYLRIGVDGKVYYAHRLAFFYINGYWPETIDHKNHNKTDNRLAEIREATHSQNQCNRRRQNNNKSGYVGVFFVRTCKSKPWKAYVDVENRRKYLGYFETAGEANLARICEMKILHGEFAMVSS